MTDLHEVGVVSGLKGIESILKEAEATDLKIYFVVPSHVPFSPNLETSGGRFNPEIIRKALQRPDAVGLSECVGPYILAEFPDLLEAFDDTLAIPGMTLQGHLPDMYGPAMSACVAAGVSTDHESFCDKAVFERLRNGCHLMMREASAARNMPALLKTVMEHNLDTSMVSIVTDDLRAVDLQTRGHLDDSLRTALGMGLDFVKAIQMVTVNCARAFNLEREIGGLAPGRRADINITTGPENFRVLSTFAGGRRITEDGKLLVHYETAVHEPCVLNTMHLKNPIAADSFKLHAPEGAKKVKAIVMDTLPYIPFTNRREVELNVVDGVVQCDMEQDVLYIAQVERHGKNGNIGKAFMGGFHIRGGAMASSVGHDNHNIVVMGDNFEDMALAVNRCAELGVRVALSDGFALGGKGAVDVARAVIEAAEDVHPLNFTYEADAPVMEKVEKIAKTIYGAAAVELAPAAAKDLKRLQDLGFDRLPVCIAKTPFSFSHDPKLLGAPKGFTLPVQRLILNAGAGFVVVTTGAIMRMPGLPKVPAAMSIDVKDGKITGLA